MKLETEEQRHTFTNVIDELRKETHHEYTFITREEMDALKRIWVHSKNIQEAKEWMKVNLDWNCMTKQEKVNLIIDYYNNHFKWQKLIYGQEIDRTKVESMTDEELDNFIKEYCK